MCANAIEKESRLQQLLERELGLEQETGSDSVSHRIQLGQALAIPIVIRKWEKDKPISVVKLELRKYEPSFKHPGSLGHVL
jgi:hypothetical protein